MNKAKIIGLGVVAVLVVVLLVVFGTGKTKLVKSDDVATVNGVAITKVAYDEQMTALTKSLQAQKVDTSEPAKQAEMKKQVLDYLINNELVMQGVKSAGITVTDAEVETQFQTIVTQNGGQEGFKTALTNAGLTEEKLRTNILNQLSIQKFLAASVKTDSITVSDQEITDFYNQYKQANGTSTPALKTISAQIKQQITLNKQQTMVNDFLAGLKAKATIVINI